jgi:L-lactate dehydrogenase complex protein LldG
MTSSRDQILNKLRAAQRPFPDASNPPQDYLPVTTIEDTSPDGMLARFTEEMTRLQGEVFVVEGEDAARDKVVELLKSHNTQQLLAWHFNRIPVRKLRDAIEETDITIIQPDTHDEFRAEILEACREAEVGLTGADAVAASNGTLIVSTGQGRGRIPTILPPVHIAVVTLNQFVPRIEDWVADQRQNDLETIRTSSNVCFITGTSRTGDIEQILVLGVHGPGKVQVVVKR